ncbi:NAD(P)/FAD-dependent oxidoreductase [Halocola ammonii]
MNFSYWERESFLGDIDFAIVGSGIVGLSTAIYIKDKHPRANVVIFEREMLPTGASTRNAGFACFGSVSELLDDLDNMSEEELLNLVSMRYRGLKNLESLLSADAIDLKMTGGTEFFSPEQEDLFERCEQKINYFNALLESEIGKDVFSVIKPKRFPFRGFQQAIYNPYEGQIDTGKMMSALLKCANGRGIKVYNGAKIASFEDCKSKVKLEVSDRNFEARRLIVTTNGFASQLLEEVDVQPVRNQVLITEPIENLSWKGIFHIERGYFYFRNVGNRVLIGGGRHLQEEQEATDKFGLTDNIQSELEKILYKQILPDGSETKVDMRWSGILGVGSSRKVIIERISPRVLCGVRLGGMGIAIGSLIGKQLANHFN